MEPKWIDKSGGEVGAPGWLSESDRQRLRETKTYPYRIGWRETWSQGFFVAGHHRVRKVRHEKDMAFSRYVYQEMEGN